MSVSIRLTPEEKSLAQAYADMHSIPLSEAFKRALFDKIEDEYEVRIAENAYAEYMQDPKTVSHAEAGNILGLK